MRRACSASDADNVIGIGPFVRVCLAVIAERTVTSGHHRRHALAHGLLDIVAPQVRLQRSAINAILCELRV
jgi:hypothetical protein